MGWLDDELASGKYELSKDILMGNGGRFGRGLV